MVTPLQLLSAGGFNCFWFTVMGMLALLKVSIFIFFSRMGFVLFCVSTNGSLFLSDTVLEETDDLWSLCDSPKLLFFFLLVFFTLLYCCFIPLIFFCWWWLICSVWDSNGVSVFFGIWLAICLFVRFNRAVFFALIFGMLTVRFLFFFPSICSDGQR